MTAIRGVCMRCPSCNSDFRQLRSDSRKLSNKCDLGGIEEMEVQRRTIRTSYPRWSAITLTSHIVGGRKT